MSDFFKTTPTSKRYTLHPLQHEDLYKFYSKIQSSIWHQGDIPYSNDKDHWENKLTEDEKHFVKHVLAFFAASDGIVNENLANNMLDEIGITEAEFYYGEQIAQENVHSDVYSRLILGAGISDKEKEHLLDALNTMPAVAKKSQWAIDWIDKGNIVDKLVAFSIVEGIMFSASFCAIYYMKNKGLLPALSLANDYISRDECYIEGTEVLTEKGWKDISTVNIKDKVIGYKNGIGTLEEVQRIISKPYTGEMFVFEGVKNKTVVTPNHEMIIQKRFDKSYHKVLAKDLLLNNSKSIPHSFNYNSQGESNLSNLDRLKIALQADGSNSKWKNNKDEVFNRGKDGGHTHSIFISKTRKIERLEMLLETENIKYNKIEENNRKGFKYTFYLEYNFDCKCLNWLYNIELNKNTCIDIINEVIQWDGHIRPDVSTDSVLYCSTNKECIDTIQHIAILAGYNTKIMKSVDNRKKSYKDYYRLAIRRDVPEFVMSSGYNKSTINYSGNVYCLTVPSGGLITRYEDKTFIAGNCGHRDFAVYLYKYYVKDEHKLSKEKLQEIIKSAVEIEVDFATESLPVSLIGMDGNKMSQYIRYVANDLYLDLSEDTQNLYNDSNPFPFMEMIALENKTNFFEFRVSEYQKNNSSSNISITEDF